MIDLALCVMENTLRPYILNTFDLGRGKPVQPVYTLFSNNPRGNNVAVDDSGDCSTNVDKFRQDCPMKLWTFYIY